MPKDFGEWMGGATPLDFNDPGNLPSSKPAAKRHKCDGNHGGPACADPECWHGSAHLTEGMQYTLAPRRAGKTLSTASLLLTDRFGFTYSPQADCFHRQCRLCSQRIIIGAIDAVKYLQAHAQHAKDPQCCMACNRFKITP